MRSLTEHARHFSHIVVYLRYDMPSKLFQTIRGSVKQVVIESNALHYVHSGKPHHTLPSEFGNRFSFEKIVFVQNIT
jgi:hypothetical protein